MKENQDKKLEKWESEIEVLEKIKDLLVKYSKLKDEKAEKDKIDRMNAKIASLIEDNFWTRLEWGTIKRGKQSREDGLKKIEKKIADREKKIAAHKAELEEAGGTAGRDWTAEIEACVTPCGTSLAACGRMRFATDLQVRISLSAKASSGLS